MKMISFFLAALFLAIPVFSQKEPLYVTEKDRAIFDSYIKFATAEKLQSEDVVIASASYFLDVPYVAATLEKEPEGLVVNLREMDCTTFVETVFALSKTFMEGRHTFEDFCRNLQQFRYRNGTPDGYISRLHYTTDWIYENERKGLVEDITKKAGGEPLRDPVFFMSRNADIYKQLVEDPGLIDEIAAIEQSISKRAYFYIPKDRIDACATLIKNGDMVCFVTSIDGLDVSHVGIARWVSGKLSFMHASSAKKRVIVEPRTMQEYTEAISNNTGVIIVRPLFH